MIDWFERLIFFERKKDADHHLSCDGDQCFFMASALLDPFVFSSEIWMSLSFNEAKAHWTRTGFNYSPALEMRTDFFLFALSLLAGADPHQLTRRA